MMGDIYKKYRQAYEAVGNPSKDGYNPHFKNTYASLGSTLAVIRPACAAAGIVYQQSLRETRLADKSEPHYVLEPRLFDDEGGCITLSQFPVDSSGNAQAFGSEMTYKRRQQAQADWGITGEDDDAEAATGQPILPTGSYTKPKANRFAKLTQLKEDGLSLGISEGTMTERINAVLNGKPMKEATDSEIEACESCLTMMIREVSDVD